jgi:hypothetical protein
MAQITLNSSGVASNGSLLLQSNGTTTAVTIDTAQNVGVGVTPSAWTAYSGNLQTQGGSIFGTAGSETNYGLNAYYNAGYKYVANGYSSIYQQYAGQHIWKTAASGTAGNAISFTQAMTLDASGNLGIGTTSPATTLHLNGATSGAAKLRVGRSTSDTNFIQLQMNGGDSVIVANGVTGTNGSLLFGRDANTGTFTESARFDSSGYFKCIGLWNLTSASAANLFVDNTGQVFRSTSARKYKHDIRDLENIDINLLRPIRYKSKCEMDDQTIDHFGIVADEAHDAGITELVNYGADGEVEGFQYERLTVVLLKAMQTLKADLDATKAELAALKGTA